MNNNSYSLPTGDGGDACRADLPQRQSERTVRELRQDVLSTSPFPLLIRRHPPRHPRPPRQGHLHAATTTPLPAAAALPAAAPAPGPRHGRAAAPAQLPRTPETHAGGAARRTEERDQLERGRAAGDVQQRVEMRRLRGEDGAPAAASAAAHPKPELEFEVRGGVFCLSSSRSVEIDKCRIFAWCFVCDSCEYRTIEAENYAGQFYNAELLFFIYIVL